jgi:uroporphyrinogen-III decarboxylase
MEKKALYNERLNRIRKTISLSTVDRLPVAYAGTAFSPRYMGMPMDEFCEDAEAAVNVTLAAMDRLGGFGELDAINQPVIGRMTPKLSYAWLSRVSVPGKELPRDSLWQVVEAESMTVDEYDTILEKGWMTYLMEFLPRVIEQDEFNTFLEWVMLNQERTQSRYRDHGYVIISDALPAMIPFEHLSGGRSMSKFFLDLYRIPDKVEAVMKQMFTETLDQIRASVPRNGINGAWVGGWRSASTLVAPKLWDRFVWPYILEVVEVLVEKGFTPVLHWDQDWTRDLIRLQELPAKKCILNPDGMTDLKAFKKLAGDRMAVMGDVPSALLSAGTPEDVDFYIKERVDLFQGTGLILCPGCDAPINAKPENMEAFIKAASVHGRNK